MSTFRVVKDKNFTVMSNHHLKNINLSLKAKGLLSLMLSLPDTWDYTQEGLAAICKDGLSSIRSALKELEDERYLITNRMRDDKGLLRGTEYIIYEFPHDEISAIDNDIDEIENKSENSENVDIARFQPICENRILDEYKEKNEPICDFPRLEKPILENRRQSNKDILNKDYINNIYNISSNHISKDNHIRDQDKSEDEIREEVMYQIEYECFDGDVMEQQMAKEICEIMVEYLMRTQQYVAISGKDVKISELQSRLRGLTHEHIDYVIKSIRQTSKPVKKMKQYILTSLYNAAVTYNSHMQVGMDYFIEHMHDD
ncbi:MAG: helix-turn-helix domain-containing protein [Lachnospiraceae bacterium]|nr:helix-turn-helix domain-containing protein [Lachnospiraceae bacterium]